MRREPVLGVLVVERPRGYDNEECERGAGEANVECHSNVLLQEANDECNDLYCQLVEVYEAGKGHIRQPHQAGQCSASLQAADPQSPGRISTCIKSSSGVAVAYNLALDRVAHLLQKLVGHGDGVCWMSES